MTEHRQFKAKVFVRFKRRDDGGLRAECEQVPGFYLSSTDRRAVMADVIPALELLVRTNLGIPVQVSPLGYAFYQLSETVDEGSVEIPADVEECTKEYIVEKIAA